MGKKVEKCSCCGANMMVHRYGFNAAIAKFLVRLAEVTKNKHVKQAHIRDLGLTHSEKCNFNRVQHWGLAYPAIDIEGKYKQGEWYLADKGYDFVRGKIKIPKYVMVFRNSVRNYEEEPMINIREALKDNTYLYREDYLNTSEQADENQLVLGV